MRELAFRLLDVFAIDGRPFTGNALCVFEDGRGLSAETMQALALEMAVAETTFLLPPSSPGVDADVRIFTPSIEMPFAGHPTLGTAFVARERRGSGDRVVLSMRAGEVTVTAEGDVLTLRAAKAPRARAPQATRAELAIALGLEERDLAGDPLWIDTGVEQLVIPLVDAAAVRRTTPVPSLLGRHAFSAEAGESMAYVVARTGDHEAEVRFFSVPRGAVVEDAATGSACANLGGYLLATGAPTPASIVVHQGERAGRPSRLVLTVDERGGVFVGGRVVPVGRGVITLPVG
jgi:PhzF family phenazine biosynthesis protein